MKFILFSGSLRTGSLNKKLLNVAHHLIQQEPACLSEIIDIRALSIPVYDGDIEQQGMPAGVSHLGSLITAADAIIISSPEYNGSIAGSLKNTIDWVSRLRPVPLENKPVLLMGASPGYFGAIRGLGFSRAPFETLNAFLYPQSFALPKANEAFSDSGELKDEGTQKKLKTLIQGYIRFAKKMN